MKFFEDLFGKRVEAAKPVEQAVIVHVPLSNAQDGTVEEFDHLIAIEEEMRAAIANAGFGEFDGNEFGQGEFTYFMYAPDAERMFALVEPILRRDAHTSRGYALVRFGPPGSLQRRVDLDRTKHE